MDQSESAILTMWDADIVPPWLQPWVHRKDEHLINYSPICRAYPRAKDSAAAQPADSGSNNSPGTICPDARLPCPQSIRRLILPKEVPGKWHSRSRWLRVHWTRHSYSSSWSPVSLCFPMACSNRQGTLPHHWKPARKHVSTGRFPHYAQ